ncbi:hypothetical protein B0H10DRAFT_1267819 [Mycena sp. CBHHK59/15]|nr:hypothetical protein B0H10DRAFT_1267819 [Mycena sp. CBHHK59/15]
MYVEEKERSCCSLETCIRPEIYTSKVMIDLQLLILIGSEVKANMIDLVSYFAEASLHPPFTAEYIFRRGIIGSCFSLSPLLSIILCIFLYFFFSHLCRCWPASNHPLSLLSICLLTQPLSLPHYLLQYARVASYHRCCTPRYHLCCRHRPLVPQDAEQRPLDYGTRLPPPL